mmetsp:Transcript_4567/g.8807  ORF Transcript_4567/g.8807 Transcript_4567/m.8807 type:complete len:132 (-) Transcript_4567:211-606(-)
MSNKNYLCQACVCCYQSIDIDDIKIGLKESHECLCCTNACCLALNEDSLGLGVVTESNEICKIALVVCSMGLKKPATLCAQASHCLCFKAASSFPFDGAYVGSPVCAICFVKLYPEVGILKAPPTSSAISR